MAKKIKIIKTLPHIPQLFLNQNKDYVFANTYSEDILSFITTIEKFKKEEIKFSDFLNTLSRVSSNKSKVDLLERYKTEVYQFERVESVESVLDFSLKGDIISVWLPGYEAPVRFEFFDQECESITHFDPITKKTFQSLEYIFMSRSLPRDRGSLEEVNVVYGGKSHFDKSHFDRLSVTEDNPSVTESKLGVTEDKPSMTAKTSGARNNISGVQQFFEKIIFTNKKVDGIQEFHSDINFEIIETDFSFPPLFFGKTYLFENEIKNKLEDGFNVSIITNHTKDISDSLKPLINKNQDIKNIKTDDFELLTEELDNLSAGFISVIEKIAIYTDREIFGSIYLNKEKAKSHTSSDRLKKLLSQLEGEISVGDYVVHEDYGVGIYAGLEREEADGIVQDYLLIKFENEDLVYVPLTQLEKITKYLGNSDSSPRLTKLNTGGWKKTKQKIKKTTQILAKQLLEHMAKREVAKAFAVENKDSDDYQLFVDNFPYQETRDQINAINEVVTDLEKEMPMNRLLVGDVGFGKTEVIMRAAFKIVEAGLQVAVLSPTTILSAQHFETFTQRFKNFPFKTGVISRFNTPRKNREIVDKINAGQIDIAIGTHRLLSSDVKFKELGLVVIDEEQKFGVKQKEKIKRLNYGTHLLSVSATPIPRTLSLALSSIQEISVITTPPQKRKPVETILIWDNWKKATDAIEFEIKRGGQAFFVHNRVETIAAQKAKLEGLLPGIRFQVAHGQMSSTELDKIMADFYQHKFDVLIATTIIENGLDLPNVNTIIIHDAQRFGLSQLYQLRGRVGRSSVNGFCYLMAPGSVRKRGQEPQDRLISTKSKKNEPQKLYLETLNSLVENSQLGSGFQIASKDLEIRGAGDILGEKQHGHIAEIGYALYIEMLTKEIEKLRVSF